MHYARKSSLTSSLMFSVTSRECNSQETHTLFTALRQFWTVPSCQTTSGFMAVLFIFIVRMPLLVPTLDNSDPLCALVITPGIYLHHVEVTDQDPASGSRYNRQTKYANTIRYVKINFIDVPKCPKNIYCFVNRPSFVNVQNLSNVHRVSITKIELFDNP